LLKEVKPDALLITHHHGDHVSGLDTFQQLCDCPVYHGLFALAVGDLEIQSFAVSHDIESFGYTIIGDQRVTVMLDTGIVTDEMQREIEIADILIIEANHDDKLIHLSDYNDFLKARILSDIGHLSNQQTAAAIKSCKGKIYLAHMSEETNNHAHAKTAIERLSGKKIEILGG
jgi:phosphoribosyl 1,2-cyclic phosphodiesterase